IGVAAGEPVGGMRPWPAVVREALAVHQTGVVEIPMQAPLLHGDARHAPFGTADSLGHKRGGEPAADLGRGVNGNEEWPAVAIGVKDFSKTQTRNLLKLLSDSPLGVSHSAGDS